MALSVQRSSRLRLASRASSTCRTARLVVRAGQQEQQQAVHSGHAMLAAAITASMLVGSVQLVLPQEAFAANARSGGRASASKFSSRRQAMSEPAPQVNNYSSTTIIAPPPVIAPPIISPIVPVSPFGVSIVPVIPIPLPNPFASPPPPPAPSAAETLALATAAEATAAANAAAAAATAAAAAATATAVAVAK